MADRDAQIHAQTLQYLRLAKLLTIVAIVSALITIAIQAARLFGAA